MVSVMCMVMYGNAEMSPGCDLWSVMSLGDPSAAWANISITPAPPICTSYKYQAKETFILKKTQKPKDEQQLGILRGDSGLALSQTCPERGSLAQILHN